MNIFIVDTDPIKAATMLCDRHVVKMTLETAQLLCNALDTNTPYKKTHLHHPCTIWVRQSISNFNWLVEHGIALVNEYHKRYGKYHKSMDVILHCQTLQQFHPNKDNKTLTPFVQAMPDKYKDINVVNAYRKYYISEKARFAKWSKLNNEPEWWSKK